MLSGGAASDDEIPRVRVMRVIARLNVGGPALQTAALMRGLDRQRFDQRLYAGTVDDNEADYMQLCAPDVAVHRVRSLGRSIRPTDDVRALAELTTAMRRFRPHIVHTHTAKAGALGRVAAVLARAPARVHTFHGHLLHGYFSGSKTGLVVRAERSLARVCDRLVAVGTRVRDELVAAGVGRTDQYVVVPPGRVLPSMPSRETARQRLELPVEGPVIAYVGRVTGIKRPDRFLDVARAVRQVLPAATFVVCGDGDLLAELSRATGLDGELHLLGWRADVETVYAAADLVLLTSDNEGMPVSLIEAGLAGIPAVATRVGSVAEVVEDGKTGLLTGTEAGELARGVVRLLRDDPLRRRMGRAARAGTTQRFGIDRLVSDVSEIYASIAVERGWWPPSTPEKG